MNRPAPGHCETRGGRQGCHSPLHHWKDGEISWPSWPNFLFSSVYLTGGGSFLRTTVLLLLLAKLQERPLHSRGRLKESPDTEEADQDKKADDSEKADEKGERCICSTDQVDREIEKLKEKKEDLEKKLNTETDDKKPFPLFHLSSKCC